MGKEWEVIWLWESSITSTKQMKAEFFLPALQRHVKYVWWLIRRRLSDCSSRGKRRQRYSMSGQRSPSVSLQTQAGIHSFVFCFLNESKPVMPLSFQIRVWVSMGDWRPVFFYIYIFNYLENTPKARSVKPTTSAKEELNASHVLCVCLLGLFVLGSSTSSTVHLSV